MFLDSRLTMNASVVYIHASKFLTDTLKPGIQNRMCVGINYKMYHI